VCGFLFVTDRLALWQRPGVYLILKVKPAWQRGKLNGIGGKIEPGESPLMAMHREWKEETGDDTQRSWGHFATYTFQNGVRVFFFRAMTEWRNVSSIHSATDELVSLFDAQGVLGNANGDVLPNLKWLIPLALSGECVVLTEPDELFDE